MKFKSLYIAGLTVWAFTATGCSNDDPEYVPATPVATPKAYFNPSNTYNFELGEDDSEFSVTAYRANGEGELTVPVQGSCELDKNLFNVPATVTFADGATEAEITVSFDPTDMQGAVDYVLNISIGDGVDTPYFNLTQPVTCVYFPWIDVVGANGEEYALYTDDFITTWFNVPNMTYEVKLQQSPAVKGLYRLVNPYGEAYPNNEPGDYDTSTNHYMYFNMADPNKVFLCDPKGNAVVNGSMAVFETGMDWNPTDYGQFIFTGLYNLRMAQGNEAAAVPNAGKLSKGVLTFPEKSLLARMDIYTTPGSWSYANTNGAFKLVFPGVTEEEEPEEWETLGEGEWTDALLLPLYTQAGETYTYNVPVEQLAGQDIFRMVNPYKEDICPYGSDYEGDIYIVIDCTDPEFVTIKPDYIGFDDEEDGEVWGTNIATIFLEQYNKATIINAGFNDTYDAATGVISFGPGHLVLQWPNSSNEDYATGWYSSNSEPVGSLVLPQAAAQSSAKAKAFNGTLSRNNNLLKILDSWKDTSLSNVKVFKGKLTR